MLTSFLQLLFEFVNTPFGICFICALDFGFIVAIISSIICWEREKKQKNLLDFYKDI